MILRNEKFCEKKFVILQLKSLRKKNCNFVIKKFREMICNFAIEKFAKDFRFCDCEILAGAKFANRQ